MQDTVTMPVGWYSRPDARAWSSPPPPADVLGFHRELPGYASTPLVELPALAVELGVGRVFVKDESSRLGLPAFKVLGASWAVAQVVAARNGLSGPLTLAGLSTAVAERPVRLVTATDGNHGRAVARVASLLGAAAQVIAPDVVADRAIELIEAEGARVSVLAGSYDEAVAEAARVAALDEDAELVQDTAWAGYEQVPAWIVQGYSTLTVEVDEQLAQFGSPAPSLVVVPVGVGSLAQAVVEHYRSRPDARPTSVLSAEPDTAACLLTSLLEGRPVSVTTASTVMAGLNCGTLSSLSWPVLRHGLDAAVTVSDDYARRAVRDLGAAGVSSGPSGASALAAARAALTGPGSGQRRADLAVDVRSVIVLLSTEGRASGSDRSDDPAPASP